MKNAFSVVEEFERRVAQFAGAPLAVAVDCCTHALFLSLRYCLPDKRQTVTIPAKTYLSVPMTIIHAGHEPRFEDLEWSGIYQLKPWPIWDGAKRFRKNMYQGGFQCLSFHIKKHLDIGRGGMILCEDEKSARTLKKMRYDGREGLPYPEENPDSLGWHYYLMPDQAARGLLLLDFADPEASDLTEDYPDLRKMRVFRDYL